MIKTDRKLKNALVLLNPQPDNCICYDPDEKQLQIRQNYHDVIRSVPFESSVHIVNGSIQRMASMGLLTVNLNTFQNGSFFSITDMFILRKEFWWDNFSQKFLFGYISGLISGIIVTVIGGLMLAYIRLKLGI